MQGWLKLYRKIVDNPIFCDPFLLKLWMLCLIKATHREHDQLVGNQIIKLKPGQFVTGRQALAEDYNRGMKPSDKVAESTLWRWLNNFETWGKVNIKKTNKFSVVTILNWELYQESEQQVNNKWTSNEQQMNTNKNDQECIKNDQEIVVDEEGEQISKFGLEGMPIPEDAVPTFETGADSTQKKISRSDYEKEVVDKYLKLRQAIHLSPDDEIALKEIIAEKIPLTTVLEGIEKAFVEYKPKHSRDSIRSLNYCVPIIFDLHYVKTTKPTPKAPNRFNTKTVKKDKLPEWIINQDSKPAAEEEQSISEQQKRERMKYLLKSLGELDEKKGAS